MIIFSTKARFCLSLNFLINSALTETATAYTWQILGYLEIFIKFSTAALLIVLQKTITETIHYFQTYFTTLVSLSLKRIHIHIT